MKLKKNTLQLVLLLCLITSCILLFGCDFIKTHEHNYVDGKCTICNNEIEIEFKLSVDNLSYYVSGYIGKPTKLVIPKTNNGLPVTSIGSYAFYDCNSLTRITIPKCVTSIGDKAFKGCNSLKRITIPKGVTSIGYCAFEDCTSLKRITIPESVTSIGLKAFEKCKILTYNEYENGLYLGNNKNPYLALIKAKSTDITSCVINEKTKIIVSKTFEDCKSLIYNEYENGLYLGSKENEYLVLVKTNSTNITSCEINEKTKFIASNAFYGCKKLEEIDIPEEVTYIGSYAFDSCKDLINITIPENLTSIGMYAFDDCESLRKVYYQGTIEKWCNITFDNEKSNPMAYAKSFYMLGENNEYKEVTEIVIPEGITKIKNCTFYGFYYITDITLPESLISIGYCAFSRCNKLISITLQEKVTNIGACAFDGCVNLKRITLPEGVKSIGKYAFDNCASLTSITLPESLISVGEYAFDGCKELVTVYYQGTLEKWCNITFENDTSTPMVYAKSFYMLDEHNVYKEVTEIVLLDIVTTIKDYTFEGFNNITSITLPESITSIGYCAFSGCNSLTNIMLPENVTSIVVDAFLDCNSLIYNEYENGLYLGSNKNPYLVLVKTKSTDFISFSINDKTKFIASKAFYGCKKLASIALPEEVISIGNNAFLYCTSLTNITLPNGLTNIDANAFSGCSRLTSIIIPEGVTEIGMSAFSGCSSLTSITIQEGITCINGYTFYNCTSLKSITLPEGVTSIDFSAFRDCVSLESITLTKGVTSIDSYAFDRCKSLTNVYFIGTKEEWNAISIGNGNEFFLKADVTYNYVKPD